MKIDVTYDAIILYPTSKFDEERFEDLGKQCREVTISRNSKGLILKCSIPRVEDEDDTDMDEYDDDDPRPSQRPERSFRQPEPPERQPTPSTRRIIERSHEQTKPRQLQLFRGPAEIIYHRADTRWRGITRRDSVAYCAAYDLEHALEIVQEYRGNPEFNVPLATLRARWSKGWPDFDHDPTEPGLWIAFTPDGEAEQVV
jgi:hypothetical protein